MDERGTYEISVSMNGSEEWYTSSSPEYATLVLLVDDQPIVAAAVRSLLLGASDIDLHYCSQADEAIAQANRVRPTVILQDLVLPGISGLELVRRFRDNGPTSGIPIVILSTMDDPQTKSHAFTVGANDYVVKLPDRAELIARIRYHSKAYLNQVQRDEAFQALRESQQQLLESNTALLVLNQQMNEFVGMAAHDLRNPLGVVLGFSKFMLRDKQSQLTEQQRTFLDTIQSSSNFMLALVDDLLDVSKIEAGKLTLNPQPANFLALIESNVALNRVLASEKDIEIVLDLDPSTPNAWIDLNRMEQVLNNLITNAIKYSYPKTKVEVHVCAVDGDVLLAIRDHGQGIPADELSKLFMPFSVTSVKGTHGEKSTGLGLLIAKKVVDGHHGRIWVESILGQGSTFFVALPAVAAERYPSMLVGVAVPQSII